MIYLDEGFYDPKDKDTTKALCEFSVQRDSTEGDERTVLVRIQLNYIQGHKVLLGKAVTIPVTFDNDVNALGNFCSVFDEWVKRLIEDFDFDAFEQNTIASKARSWAWDTLR